MVGFSATATTLWLTTGVVFATIAPPEGTAHIVQSIIEKDANLLDRHEGRRRLYEAGLSSQKLGLRKLEDQAGCDQSFLKCLPDLKCVDCFATLEMENIDWAGISPGTDCHDVVSFLNDAGHCKKLEGNKASIDIFCKTFNSCVVWSDDDDDAEEPEDEEGWVNCTALTECRWDGMKENWLGDGICHDNMHGCYNTAICRYDSGDCCDDTCFDGDSEFKRCGQEGFACKDPFSDSCNVDLTAKCENATPSKKTDNDDLKCDSESEQKYRLVLYDSFGDGWDNAILKLTMLGSTKKIYEGSLEDGSEGSISVCLSKKPACYSAVTSGGSWGVEVSWELKTLKEGSPAIAGGGAPSNCEFPLAGEECEKTCNGRPTEDPTDDSDYKTYKELFTCISDKCVIQLGACNKDEVCEKCFVEDAPDYCYGVDTFTAIIDCTMCSCTDRIDSDYCSQKDGPGAVIPASADTKDNDNSGPKKCSGAEIMAGANSVRAYSDCANMNDIGVMISQFDQSNFGQLDQFETCAHSFADEDNHGGHTALGCMQILKNAMDNPVAADNDKDPPKEAISALATDLYQNAENFCNCTKMASDDCPLCPSFMSFKTLLFESLDACAALDEIDCASWDEFWRPCQFNLKSEFGKTDFSMREQCDFMKSGCGGAGAFPAFRRLDCDGEIDSDGWSFYKKYSKNCLNADDFPPNNAPASSPTQAPNKGSPTAIPADIPTLVPYIPSDDEIRPSTPYVPSNSKQQSDTKKSHWFRNMVLLCLLGGAGYYVYKRRFGEFNFMQFRRARNFGYDASSSDAGGMYSNLNSSTSFEPPTLPPTPTMMGGGDSGMMGGAPQAGQGGGMQGWNMGTELT